MGRYIKAADAARYFDAATERVFREPIGARIVNAIPTVNVEEVVQCEDCEHSMNLDNTYYCAGEKCGLRQVPPNHWCSLGRRRIPSELEMLDLGKKIADEFGQMGERMKTSPSVQAVKASVDDMVSQARNAMKPKPAASDEKSDETET